MGRGHLHCAGAHQGTAVEDGSRAVARAGETPMVTGPKASGRRLATPAHVLRAVLGNGALRRVLLAYVLYTTALYGTWVAILVYAYAASGPTSVGIVAMVQLLPAAAFAPVAASLADRFARDRVLLAGYTMQAVFFGATAAGMATGSPPPLVYIAAACAAAATTFTRPAQGALLPSLSRTPEELTASNSLAGTAEGTGVLLGPLAAALILTAGTPGAVWAAGTAACAAAAILVMRVRRTRPAAAASARLPGVAQDPELPARTAAARESAGSLVAGGLTALSASPHARLLVGLLSVRMLVLGAMDVLVVLLALEVFGTGQAGAGLLAASIGLGSIVGGAASLGLVGRRRLAPALALGALAWGIALGLVATVAPAALAPVLLAAGGVGFAAIDIIGRTVLQRVTPDRQLARVLGALEGLGLLFLAAGSVLVPILTGWVGVQRALVIVGALLPASVALAWRRLTHFDRHVRVPLREMALLRATPVFAPVPAAQLETVARRTRWLTIDAGRALIREGDAGDRYYVLESGRMRVTVGGALIRVLDAVGEGIGEIALLHGVTRTATVTAIEPCVLLALEGPDFLEAITGHEQSRRIAEEAATTRAMTPS